MNGIDNPRSQIVRGPLQVSNGDMLGNRGRFAIRMAWGTGTPGWRTTCEELRRDSYTSKSSLQPYIIVNTDHTDRVVSFCPCESCPSSAIGYGNHSWLERSRSVRLATRCPPSFSSTFAKTTKTRARTIWATLATRATRRRILPADR